MNNSSTGEIRQNPRINGRRKKRGRPTNGLKAAVFFLTLIVFMVFSFLIPLRPTESESEKRELAKFPSFSIGALADGTYFDGIDEWFSDTFPAKETFLSVTSWVKGFYGYGNEVHGEVVQGDDIPDVPATN